ncbi:MAG: hypothetical protein HRU70_14835 [Phycisphaeraceae bacterium]|nr:MAG: hypothetical protein HRU70_14835 [Phycisphaeraceae bacterium]
MTQAFLKTIVVCAVLLVIGPAVGAVAATLRAADGDPHVTLLTSSSPAFGAAMAVLIMAAAAASGWVGARLFHNGTGVTLAGLVVAWASWRTASAGELWSLPGASGRVWPVAVEGLILGLLAVVAVIRVESAGRWVFHAHDQAAPVTPVARVGFVAHLRSSLVGVPALAAVGVGVLAGAAAAWLVAIEGTKGQGILAGLVAGLAAAAAGQLASLSLDAKREPTVAPALVAITLLAVGGPIAAWLMLGDGLPQAARAVASGVGVKELLPLARLTPLDWFGGALIGAPIGLGWAGSMVEKRAATPRTA